MPLFHYLHDIDDNFLDEDFIKQANYYKILTNISVMFTNTKVYNQNKGYYLGTFSEAAINFFIDKKLDVILPKFQNIKLILDRIHEYKFDYTKQNIEEIEVVLKEVNTVIFDLIIFNDKINKPMNLFETYKYMAVTHQNKEAYRAYLMTLLIIYVQIADTLVDFYEVYFHFSKVILKRIKKEADKSYLKAFEKYFNEDDVIENIGKHKKIFDVPMDRMTKSKSYFNVLKLPDKDEKTLVELSFFDDYSSFLQQEYFRALKSGHTIRICKNCERVFLQINDQDTIYCDRIYKDTGQTCRAFGPTRFHKEKVENSPIHNAYNKCYRKIYMRHYRNIIEDSEYNDLITKIIDYKDQALAGQLDVIEFQKLLENI